MTAFAAPLAIVRISAAAVLALAAAGCVTSGVNDLTGAVASYNPLGAPSAEPRAVPLLVASTYGQGGAGPAKFSEIVATVPPGHTPGHIERPVLTPESAARHVTLKSRRALTGSAFLSEVSRQLSGRQGLGRDVLVYVHGYNTGFDEAAYRVTQIVADTGFAGAAILFAWPSRNSLLGYGADKEGATASRDALEKLLRDLGANPDVGRVHVLAHSMGTWLAMESLRQAGIAGDASLGGKIGAVMLAAPDLDLDVFKSQVARIGRADNISLFIASDDRALMISARLAGSRARVGALDLMNREHRDEMTSLGVRIYDLTGSRDGGDYFRHGTYAEAPQIVKVIGSRLKEPRIAEPQGNEPESAAAEAAARAQRAQPLTNVTSETLPPPAPVATQ